MSLSSTYFFWQNYVEWVFLLPHLWQRSFKMIIILPDILLNLVNNFSIFLYLYNVEEKQLSKDRYNAQLESTSFVYKSLFSFCVSFESMSLFSVRDSILSVCVSYESLWILWVSFGVRPILLSLSYLWSFPAYILLLVWYLNLMISTSCIFIRPFIRFLLTNFISKYLRFNIWFRYNAFNI